MGSENRRRPWLLSGLILGGIVAALAGLFLVSRSKASKTRRWGE